jgi:hypothetical protein
MPILDHFSDKIKRISHFHSFHNAWATQIAFELNKILPNGFIAEPNVHIGNLGEIDVRADELLSEDKTALLTQYHAPAPRGTIQVSFPEETEIFIVNISQTRATVGVIEIVSPSNKDRPRHRNLFVSKCLSIISQGISLLIVDIVTIYPFNFHNELLRKLEATEGQMEEDWETPLYCSVYHYISEFVPNRKPLAKVRKANSLPCGTTELPVLQLWTYALKVGDIFPELPLFISSEIAAPVKLEEAYMKTCEGLRIF